MVETRKVSFKELGLTVGPGKEIWGPRRITNEAYTKLCEEILEAEARRRPLYRVSMNIDHTSKNVVFEYFPRDFEHEAQMRKVNQIMERAKIQDAKRFWNQKGGVKK